MSTYLKYNNHMILHPTDPSKYFYGIVEDPPEPEDEVTIGSQTWKNVNLAIDDGQGGIYTQTVNYGQGNVTEYYYEWDAAVRVAAAVQGWHLPSRAEWDTLLNAVGGSSTAGTKLRSTYGWTNGNGTDDYGFTVLPAGWRVKNVNPPFDYFGIVGMFWTADESSSTNAYYRYTDGASFREYNQSKTAYSWSVRLIKD